MVKARQCVGFTNHIFYTNQFMIPGKNQRWILEHFTRIELTKKANQVPSAHSKGSNFKLLFQSSYLFMLQAAASYMVDENVTHFFLLVSFETENIRIQNQPDLLLQVSFYSDKISRTKIM